MSVEAVTEVLRDAGSIPAASTIPSLSTWGRQPAQNGPKPANSGLPSQTAEVPAVNLGTLPDPGKTPSGRTPCSTRAVQEQYGSALSAEDLADVGLLAALTPERRELLRRLMAGTSTGTAQKAAWGALGALLGEEG